MDFQKCIESFNQKIDAIKQNKEIIQTNMAQYESTRNEFLTEIATMRTKLPPRETTLLESFDAITKTLEESKIEIGQNDISEKQARKCRYFNRGHCKFKQNCNFHHSTSICVKLLQNEICSGRGCSDRHPKDCRYWTRNPQGCHRKDKCDYLHAKDKKFKGSDDVITLNPTLQNQGQYSYDSDIIYNCVHCDYATDISENLKTHITAKHEESVPNNSEESFDSFPCDICGDLGYNCEGDLIRHNNDMHQNYACDQCDFEAYGQMMMEWHTSTSHAQFSCEECDFIGKNKGGLTRHKKAKHENTKEQNHISPTPGDDRVEPSLLTINFPVHFPSISSGTS